MMVWYSLPFGTGVFVRRRYVLAIPSRAPGGVGVAALEVVLFPMQRLDGPGPVLAVDAPHCVGRKVSIRRRELRVRVQVGRARHGYE